MWLAELGVRRFKVTLLGEGPEVVEPVRRCGEVGAGVEGDVGGLFSVEASDEAA